MLRKILIVDDSKLARMSVSKLLSGLRPGWTRFEAANADEAMSLVTLEEPDIILMDFNMPGLSGLELAAQLHDAYPQTPIAIVSANTQVEIIERAAQSGAKFLAKPLTEASLASFLDAAEAQLATR